MSSIFRPDGREGKLNDSWEEIQLPSSQPATPPEQQQARPYQMPLPKDVLKGQMERLLLDAQRESSGSSSSRGSTASSSRASPRSPHSPNTEPSGFGLDLGEAKQEDSITGESQENSDWILAWASRPEKIPPSDYHRYFKHKRSATSLRNTTVMRGGPFSLENLPLLLMTHACTFFLGAAAMFVYLKKYCSFTALSSSVAD